MLLLARYLLDECKQVVDIKRLVDHRAHSALLHPAAFPRGVPSRRDDDDPLIIALGCLQGV